jgi:hypothetical protein
MVLFAALHEPGCGTHSVALNPFGQGLLIEAKRIAMLRRGNAGF